MKPVLRDYREDDVPTLLRIIKSAFAEQRGQVDPPSSAEQKTIEVVEKELETADALVVEIEDELVGCVFYQPKGDSIYFDRLSVLNGYRKQGIGRRLIDEVEQRAFEAGFRRMSISVRIELKTQQAYYESQGYSIAAYEAHDGYERPTYVVMKKELTG